MVRVIGGSSSGVKRCQLYVLCGLPVACMAWLASEKSDKSK